MPLTSTYTLSATRTQTRQPRASQFGRTTATWSGSRVRGPTPMSSQAAQPKFESIPTRSRVRPAHSMTVGHPPGRSQPPPPLPPSTCRRAYAEGYVSGWFRKANTNRTIPSLTLSTSRENWAAARLGLLHQFGPRLTGTLYSQRVLLSLRTALLNPNFARNS